MEKSELLKLLGENIKKIRLEKGITQMDIVQNIQGNIDATNISRIEAGRTNPTVYTLHRIAEVLEVSVSELISFEKLET